MTLTKTVATLTDLRFQENKIQNGSMAIADGFRQINRQDLWRVHPGEYTSFMEYCLTEWPNYGWQYIKELVGASEYCHNLATTVTAPTQVDGVTVDVPALPTSHQQVRQLKGAPGGMEGQSALWGEAVSEAGGDPSDVTVQSLKEKIAKMVEVSQSEIPLGCAVKVETGSDRIVFNGYKGYVVGYGGKNTAKVIVKLPDGTMTDEMDICMNWLTPLDEPPMPMPEPKEKPQKQSLGERHKAAIALLQRVLDEGASSLCNEIRGFLACQ